MLVRMCNKCGRPVRTTNKKNKYVNIEITERSNDDMRWRTIEADLCNDCYKVIKDFLEIKDR